MTSDPNTSSTSRQRQPLYPSVPPSPRSGSSARPPSPSLWRHRDFLLLWGGQALSDIGGEVSLLAYPLLVLAFTHSPAQAGVVAALRAAPAMVLSLPAGALVDRWDRRRVMLLCDLVRALSIVSIPLAALFGALTIWQLYATSLIEGSLAVVFELAESAAVAQVVAREQLGSAIARAEFVEGTTALVGPSISGALYTLGAMIPFVADGLSYVVSLVTLTLIRTPFQNERSPAPRSAPTLPSHTRPRKRSGIAQMTVGARWVVRQPFILTMTLLMGAGAFGMSGGSLVIIVLAQQQHASAAVIGLIFAAFGVGAIGGSLLVPRLKRHLTVGQSILLSRWYFALSWPLFALLPNPFVLGAQQLGSGVVEPIEDVAYFSHRLHLIPDDLRGRVLSVCRLVPGTLRPLGLALTGILIQRLGVFPTVWLQWGWLLLTTALVTVVPYVRRERSSA
ncbi:MAG TPA: MFS transporter [Ktedonobacterales bacterium]